MLTGPVNESYDEEDENERIIPVTMVTASTSGTATTAAVHYAVAMTTSQNPHHRDPAVVEIDLLDEGTWLLALLFTRLITIAVGCKLVMLQVCGISHKLSNL